MEGLNLSDIPIDLLLNLLNIVLLFLLVRTLVYKPVRKFMDARTARVNAAAEEAAEKAAAADAREAEYTQKLADVNRESETILAQARKNAQAEAEKIVGDARAEAKTVTENARREAEQARADALRDMQGEIVDLAFDISEKLLARSVRDADTKKMADRLFDDCLGGEDTQ